MLGTKSWKRSPRTIIMFCVSAVCFFFLYLHCLSEYRGNFWLCHNAIEEVVRDAFREEVSLSLWPFRICCSAWYPILTALGKVQCLTARISSAKLDRILFEQSLWCLYTLKEEVNRGMKRPQYCHWVLHNPTVHTLLVSTLPARGERSIDDAHIPSLDFVKLCLGSYVLWIGTLFKS